MSMLHLTPVQEFMLTDLEDRRAQGLFSSNVDLMQAWCIDSAELVAELEELQRRRYVDVVWRGHGQKGWAITREGRAALKLDDLGMTKRDVRALDSY
jgi:DNA-binding PadR family transcriptional regulator